MWLCVEQFTSAGYCSATIRSLPSISLIRLSWRDTASFLGPLTRAHSFYYFSYLTVNIFCSTFRVSSVADVGTRAGELSLINVIPSYSAQHLSFMSDTLGLSLRAYRTLRTTTGVMSVALGLVHTGIMIAKKQELKIISSFRSIIWTPGKISASLER